MKRELAGSGPLKFTEFHYIIFSNLQASSNADCIDTKVCFLQSSDMHLLLEVFLGASSSLYVRQILVYLKGYLNKVLRFKIRWLVPRSITRKPRKFSFHSQTKYSPPIITFAQGFNSDLDFFFQMSKKSDFPPILLILSAEPIRRTGGNF